MTTTGDDRPVPLPVPDLDACTPDPGVTDADRNRYGVLLDHAAERGLLAPAEYRSRLEELAVATSVDDLRRIVTELPAFGGAGASPPARGVVATAPAAARTADALAGAHGPGTDAALWAGPTPSPRRRSGGNPWVMLAVMVVILVAAMIGLALVAAHFAHPHPGGTGGSGVVGLSRPLL